MSFIHDEYYTTHDTVYPNAQTHTHTHVQINIMLYYKIHSKLVTISWVKDSYDFPRGRIKGVLSITRWL